jgi:hypothetical protein
MHSVTKAGNYFRRLAKRFGMPKITRQHRDYIENFDADYVRNTPAEDLDREIGITGGVSIFVSGPRANSSSYFLRELSLKVRKDKQLQAELSRKLEQDSMVGLASLCRGRRTPACEARKYFAKLAEKYAQN